MPLARTKIWQREISNGKEEKAAENLDAAYTDTEDGQGPSVCKHQNRSGVQGDKIGRETETQVCSTAAKETTLQFPIGLKGRRKW